MDVQDIVEPVPANAPKQSQGFRASRYQTWISCKVEIHRFYMMEKNTLPKTMEHFEREYGLKACTRTWKAKLKEWKFEKYLVDKDKNITVAKLDKRLREEEETIVFHRDSQLSTVRLEHFKRSKYENGFEAVSPSAATREDLKYRDPSAPEHGSPDTILDEIESIQPKISKDTQDVDTLSPICPASLGTDRFQLGKAAKALLEVLTPLTTGSDNELVEQWIARQRKHNEVLVVSLCHQHIVGGRKIADIQKRAAEAERIREDIPSVLRREETGKASLAAHKASLKMKRTIENDYSLFRKAKESKIVQIKANIMFNDWSDSWCDGCKRIIGARIYYTCIRCPFDKRVQYCSGCYSDVNGYCLGREHQLQPNESFLRSKGPTAYDPDSTRRCDALDCNKNISGLYFHCCICDNDDFDICLQCAMGGRGCHDPDHILICGVRPVD